LRRIGALVAAAVVLAGCGGDDRPSAATWRATWEQAQQIVPASDALDGPVAEAACQDALGELRTIREDLIPGPDQVVGEAATAWIDHAEQMFFDCFEDGSGDGSATVVADAYDELERYRDEVDAALASVDETG
jgi:hypothetical protein